jgi:hypothetical protein
MKKISMAVAVVLLAGVANTWAQTNAYLVDVKGTITQKDGTKILVKDVSKGVSALVSPTNLDLVVIVSQTDDAIEIDEVNPLTTNIVHGVVASGNLAVLDSGAFGGALGPIGDGRNGSTTNFAAGVPSLGGGLLITGTLKGGTKASVSGTLSGVWNDHVNGDTTEPASLFKGTIKSIATNPVPVNCCNSF